MTGGELGGRGAAIVAGLFKARIFILAAALALTALAGFTIFRLPPVFLVSILELSAFVALIWACGVYALLLSVRLAVIAVLAPWIGWFWLLGIAAYWNMAPLATASFPSVVAGLLIAAFGVHAMAAALTQGADKLAAVRSALGITLAVGIPTLLSASASMAAITYPSFHVGLIIPTSFVIMLVVCVLPPPLVASLLRFNEAFIARTNRARERREWLISFFAMLSVPRWAFTTVGITAVLSTVIYFDKSFAPLWQTVGVPFAIAFTVVGVLGAIVMRNWRCVFSCAVPPFLASIIGAWVIMELGVAPDSVREIAPAVVLMVGSAIGAGFIYFLATPTTAYQRAGDPMIIAFSRALNETGAVIIILGIGLALPMLVFLPGLALLPLFHIIGALVLFPAIATALDDLFPRRRSLEELYRAR